MRRLLKNQRGTTHIVAVLGVVIVAIVAFAGYRVAHPSKLPSTTTSTSSSTSPAVATTSPPTSIKSKADINKALQALNSDQISSQLDPGQLNADLNSLL